MHWDLWRIIHNPVLLPLLTAFLLAQGIKVVIHWLRTREVDWKLMLSTGGMPSSHSSSIMAVTTTIGLMAGFDSLLFGLAAVVSIITMHDAAGVRYESGKQAQQINTIVELLSDGHFETHFTELKELLGHRPLEVLAGALLGILVAVVFALAV